MPGLSGDIQTIRPGSSVPIAGPIPSSDVTGTTTNDDAPSGSIGEFASATLAAASAIALTDTVAANVRSLALGAGDWDVSGVIVFQASATITAAAAGISSSSGTQATQNSGALNASNLFPAGAFTGDAPLLTPVVRMSLAAPTTVYLVASAGFSGAGITAYGTIRARRVR